MRPLTRRAALFSAGALTGGAAASRLVPGRGYAPAEAAARPLPEGWLDDASGLSATPVTRILRVSGGADAVMLTALRREMAEARAEGRPFAIGAARHSMGAQSIPRDGSAMTWASGVVEPDSGAMTARVSAGATWAQVITALDPLGLSPAVMQSNHDFGVGATFCVNAHGWPVPFGPMGATVREADLMLADGTVITCSREREPDLFALAMGGYGLVGAVLSLTIDVVPNLRLVPVFEAVAGDKLGQAFLRALSDPAVQMAYGRLSVGRADLFRHGLMISYRPTEDQSALPPASGSGLVSRLAARVYRAQLHNEAVKALRWRLESRALPALSGASTRNSLMNEPVSTLDDRDPLRTDVLHEYFVPPERFGEFVAACREVIPSSYQELLNVTVRYVAPDPVSRLAYAPQARLAAVMSFSQEMTARAEADMARLTRGLIDAMSGIGGSYYLPYRPHATVDQFLRAYPGAAGFAAAKRGLDPGLLFRNGLWDNYLGRL